jgi:hypothetical protein
MDRKKDAPPKSAYELAMERLTAQDRAKGIVKRPLSGEQKERIAALRQKARAGLAELEILLGKSTGEAMGDPEKLAEIKKHYEIDRRRIASKLEDDVARIKSEGRSPS